MPVPLYVDKDGECVPWDGKVEVKESFKIQESGELDFTLVIQIVNTMLLLGILLALLFGG